MTSQLDDARRGQATAKEEHDLVVTCLAKLRLSNRLMKQRMEKLKQEVPEAQKFITEHKNEFESRPGTAMGMSRPGTAMGVSRPGTAAAAAAQTFVMEVQTEEQSSAEVIRQVVDDVNHDMPDLTETDMLELMYDRVIFCMMTYITEHVFCRESRKGDRDGKKWRLSSRPSTAQSTRPPARIPSAKGKFIL